MLNFLKKNWFVSLIVLVFAGFSIFYIYDTNKGKLKGKSVNGEDVVYSINDEDITISQFYDDLYKSNGSNSIIALFESTVANAGITTTNEIKDAAEQQASSIVASFQSQYGSAYEDYLKSALAETGYTDLVDYLIASEKVNQITADYAKANFDDLKIRDISYILIMFENPGEPADSPTDDEKARMKAVDDAFAAGKEFGEIASEFSEDTSTASTGGKLGIIDKNSSLDTAFLEAALALQDGEMTSDWIKSTRTDYGYFKIINNASTMATLENAYLNTNPYLELVQTNDATLANKALWAKAQELGVDFNGNEEIEKVIKDYFAVEEGE